ncbi:MAG: hypothetical protein ACK50J_13085, partial [Planctomyces sp.]
TASAECCPSACDGNNTSGLRKSADGNNAQERYETQSQARRVAINGRIEDNSVFAEDLFR